MRTAIVYDYLPAQAGGAEQVLPELIALFWPNCELFLGAVLVSPFSTVYVQKLKQRFPGLIVHIGLTIAGDDPIAFRYMNIQLPGILGNFNLGDFDLIFSYTAFLAHCIVPGTRSKTIAYINTPARFLWNLSHSQSLLKRITPQPIALMLTEDMKMHDVSAMQQTDLVIAISDAVRKRIQTFYNRSSYVVYPPVFLPTPSLDTARSTLVQKEFGQYLLHLSRIESYKNIQLALRTAAENKWQTPLIIAGSGPYATKLVELAQQLFKTTVVSIDSPALAKKIQKVGPCIFTGAIDNDTKTLLFQHAWATLSLNDEDFGITKIESLALGTPVIALNAGAAPEIIQSGINGILFDEATTQSLQQAITQHAGMQYDRNGLRRSVEKFSVSAFARNMSTVLTNAGIR